MMGKVIEMGSMVIIPKKGKEPAIVIDMREHRLRKLRRMILDKHNKEK